VTLSGEGNDQVAPALADAIQPQTNRDVTRMTTLIMTGVTAMSRGTAEKMEQKGYLYPSLVISDTLSAADITHVSNEVPFIKGCEVNNTYMNLVLCSDYPYLQALEAIGVDIVGLSGNHVNDFGREGARESLQFYKDNHIPIYGSGLNEEEACKPLMWESNGNTYAFLAALAWWPEEAWATATEPGACYYWENRTKIINMIHDLSQKVDIVSVELQYEETYNPWPTRDQVEEFRALHNAGADIVTGVQSHVPQAAEPYGKQDPGGPAMINYGLGNLFFDQMQSWETRTGLIARHTIYNGQLLSSELLTTVLEDFAQPRWATPEERAEILKSIFEAAPPRDRLPDIPTPTPEPTPQAATEPTPAVGQVDTGLYPAGGQAGHPQPTPPPAGVAVLPWPGHQEAGDPHFLLSRPTGPEANRVEDLGYAFASTANGRYRVHHGVDIANPSGTPLMAPADGVVVYAGPDDDAHQYGPYSDFYGNVVLFQLDQTWQGHTVYVLYGHLQQVQVAPGQRVARGEQVGLTGMAGIAIGPHVHVEVRLDTPGGYNAVYNPMLWIEPFAGYGVIAGQVLTPDGRAWSDVKVHAYRLNEDGARLYRVFSTYALDDGVHPDPQLGENAVLSTVPAGEYELVLKLNGTTYRQKLYVAPGEVGWFSFLVPG
jgi:murein DD-endopeptidase MepM/ murein hydrolase activator NlpD